MLTLTYKHLNNKDFNDAIRKLATCSEIKTAGLLLRLVKSYKSIVTAQQTFNDVHRKLLEQHGSANGDGTYKILNIEAFDKDFAELLKTEFEVEGESYKFNDLLPAKLSAADVAALDILVTL